LDLKFLIPMEELNFQFSPTTLPHREEFTEHGCGASNGEGKVGCDGHISVHPRHNIVMGQSKYREESSIGCSLDSAKVLNCWLFWIFKLF
jgi:hypothetical protein